MNPLELINSALERASRAGCFGLKENAEIFSALSQIANTLANNGAKELKNTGTEEKVDKSGDESHVPHPPLHPKG